MNKTATPSDHGSGHDSHKVKFDTFKVVEVIRVENLDRWREYALKRKSTRAGKPISSDCPSVKTVGFKPHRSMREPLLHDEKNEHFMFHGTPDGVHQLIMDQGFDHRLGVSNSGTKQAAIKGFFGQGIYFADASSKSDQYVPPTTLTGKPQWMFLARVLFGTHHRTTEPMEGTVRPPCVHGHTAPGCSHA